MKNDSNTPVSGFEGPERLLTAVEVARFMKLTKGTIYRWAKKDHIPCIKFGDAVRFSSASLRLWLSNRTNQGGGRHE